MDKKRTKVYLNGGVKERVFEDGNSIFNVWLKLDHAKENGFIRQTKNGEDIIVFDIEKRKEESDWGDTHSMFRRIQEDKPRASQSYAKPKAYAAPKAKQEESGEDELPF